LKRTPLTLANLNSPLTLTLARNMRATRSPLTAEELGEFAPPRASSVVFGEEWHLDILDALDAGYPVRVVGRAGTGKDYFIEQMSAVCGGPLLSLSIKPDLDINEWVASTTLVVEGGATTSKVVEGPLARAVRGLPYTRNGVEMRHPVTILISDVDRAQPRQVEVLRQALQSQGEQYLTNPVTGEKIPVCQGTRFYLTANAGVDGDGGRGNVSAQLDTSIVNRTMGVLASEPTPEYERKILQSRFPERSKEEIALVVKLMRGVKKAVEEGGIPLEISIRSSIQTLDLSARHLSRGASFHDALRASMRAFKGHLMEADNRALIDGAVEAQLGAQTSATQGAPSAQSPIDF